MRWMLMAVLMVGCGGSENQVAPYNLVGEWNIYTTVGPPAATMDLKAGLASGSYTEAGTDYALTAHSFDPEKPDFSLTFGSKTVAGHLLLGTSNSNVFNGTLDGVEIQGVRSR